MTLPFLHVVGRGTAQRLFLRLDTAGQDRKRHFNDQPSVACIPCLHRAFVKPDGGLCNGKSQACPAAFPVPSMLYAVERLEEMRDGLFRDTLSMVPYGDQSARSAIVLYPAQ